MGCIGDKVFLKIKGFFQPTNHTIKSFGKQRNFISTISLIHTTVQTCNTNSTHLFHNF